MKRLLAVLLVLAAVVLLSACAATAAPTAPAAPAPATAAPAVDPTAAPTTAPAPTVAATVAPVATDAPAAAEGDAQNGALLFVQNGCSGCHGPKAGGGGGPTLAGRGLEVDFVLGKVREGPGGMPEFTSDKVTDTDVHDIVAWLSSL